MNGALISTDPLMDAHDHEGNDAVGSCDVHLSVYDYESTGGIREDWPLTCPPNEYGLEGCIVFRINIQYYSVPQSGQFILIAVSACMQLQYETRGSAEDGLVAKYHLLDQPS